MNRNTRFLIIGLGLIGGAYARRLTAMGYHVDALDINPDSIAYALEEGIIQSGADFSEELISNADFVIFGLYPTTMIDWLQSHQQRQKRRCGRDPRLPAHGCGVHRLASHGRQRAFRRTQQR